MNLKKTELRNKLEFETLRATLLAASYIADLGGINAFHPSDEMVLKAYKIVKENRKQKSEKAKKRKQLKDDNNNIPAKRH